MVPVSSKRILPENACGSAMPMKVRSALKRWKGDSHIP
jgi:hypothetical protein